MADAPSRTAGDVVADVLTQAGVDAVFGIHGAHVETFFQGAARHGIRVVDVRHESAAGHAAEAYARRTRRLGVAVVTAGPGLTNAVTSIANAYVDKTPVLYISGATSLGAVETNNLQDGVDQIALARPITKWAHQVNRPDDVERLVRQAIRVATTPPMGPVLLNVPIDVGRVALPDGGPAAGDPITRVRRLPDPDGIAAAAEALRRADRPVVMAGADAWYADGGRALLAFAEQTGIPVFSDYAAHGLIPADHPLYGGTTHKLAYVGDDRADLVVALGIRFGLFTVGRAAPLLDPDAVVVHVNWDGAEIGRIRAVDVPIVADPGEVLAALGQELVDIDASRWSEWAAVVAKARSSRREALREETEAYPGFHPLVAATTVAAVAAETDAILVADGAEASYHWLHEAVAQPSPGSYLTHGHLGAMGTGLGLAIGAQVASPDRRVILVTGDGAVGFTVAEFDTMVRHRLPIVVVVANNRSWGASEHLQRNGPTGNVVGTSLADTAHYDQVAMGFGCDGVSVEHPADLRPAMESALRSGQPTCIDVRVDLAPSPPEMALMRLTAS